MAITAKTLDDLIAHINKTVDFDNEVKSHNINYLCITQSKNGWDFEFYRKKYNLKRLVLIPFIKNPSFWLKNYLVGNNYSDILINTEINVKKVN